MTVNEFVLKVAKIEGYMQNDFNRDILVLACNDLAAKIANRVREKNVLGSGKSYDYSTKTTLVGASSFNTKGAFNTVLAQANKGEESGVHWVTIKKGGVAYRLLVLPGGYDAIRKLEGHLNKKKNYSRTGEMWQGFGIKKQEKNKVEIGGTTATSQNKINWNTNRDQDMIIAPTQEEVEQMKQFIERNVKKYIDATLSGK